jgi:hypothetical protein
MLKFDCLMLDFLLYDILSHVNVFGSSTKLVAVEVKYSRFVNNFGDFVTMSSCLPLSFRASPRYCFSCESEYI